MTNFTAKIHSSFPKIRAIASGLKFQFSGVPSTSNPRGYNILLRAFSDHLRTKGTIVSTCFASEQMVLSEFWIDPDTSGSVPSDSLRESSLMRLSLADGVLYKSVNSDASDDHSLLNVGISQHISLLLLSCSVQQEFSEAVRIVRR